MADGGRLMDWIEDQETERLRDEETGFIEESAGRRL
jgi:hypothetical protein